MTQPEEPYCEECGEYDVPLALVNTGPGESVVMCERCAARWDAEG